MSESTQPSRRNTKWVAPAKGGYSAAPNGTGRTSAAPRTPPPNPASATPARMPERSGDRS